MPELPEVEIVCREMRQALLTQTIQKVEVRKRRLRFLIPPAFEKNLEHLTISSLQRRAKYILVGFQGTSDTLVIHLGMSGRISLLSSAESTLCHKHEHVIFTFTSGKEMRFFDPRRFGSMVLMATPTSLFHKIGPEPLSEDFSAITLKDSLLNKKSSIKSALLNQHIIVGLGNIYVSEALHKAQIHPERLAKDLNLYECDALVSAIKKILQRAIAAGGSTLRDHQRTNGEAGSFQKQFAVYNQEGKNCPNCQESVIERILQANRSTYFCKKCQH